MAGHKRNVERDSAPVMILGRELSVRCWNLLSEIEVAICGQNRWWMGERPDWRVDGIIRGRQK